MAMNTAETLLPILFKVLFGLVIINMLINLILLYTEKKRMYKILALYWPSVLTVFLMQAFFQQGNLSIILGYSAFYLPVCIFCMIGFEALGRSFPWKKYLIYFLPFYPLTFLLNTFDLQFSYLAMPFALAVATPLLHTFSLIEYKDRKRSSRLQKVLGFIYLGMAIHSINFALFRIEPGAQLWGWAVSYALYDSLAVLLPAIALEEVTKTEKERLQKMVQLRTSELNDSLKKNDDLVKIMIHDISNPLFVAKVHMSRIQTSLENQNSLAKTQTSLEAIENIITQIRELQVKKRKSVALAPVHIEECFQELTFLFSESLERKNMTLILNNKLAAETRVLTEKVSFTHSVLSNLVSNGLKFSQPYSSIEIIVEESHDKVILNVRDQGPGIPLHIIESVLNGKDSLSSTGTQGEQGSGFGLSIVKSFVDAYGGSLDFITNDSPDNQENIGSNIRITLAKAFESR
jgi:signal transduction histidine kinase